MKIFLYIAINFLYCITVFGQEDMITLITKKSKESDVMKHLTYLSEKTPARMSSSNHNLEAVEYLKRMMMDYDLEVRTQAVKVPNWSPGITKVEIIGKGSRKQLNSIPLGLSVGTEGKDIIAPVVEIDSREVLDKQANLMGKIVFLNQPMDTTENAYSKAGWQRVYGASLAQEKGAIAVIIRSITTIIDDNPHTGTLAHDKNIQIPSIAISTVAANELSDEIKANPGLTLRINSTSVRNEDSTGHNLTGEIKGSEFPERIILISAHIDSWFNSQGAQDNAAGCIQAVEVLRLFKELQIQPRHTIRVLIYQDEEISLSGIKHYAEQMHNKKEAHLYNLELDSGAEEPYGFGLFERPEQASRVENLVSGKLNTVIEKIPFEAADFWPLSKDAAVPVYFYKTKRSDYFDIHHSILDNIEKVNSAKLSQACALIAGFIYLTDKNLN